MKRQAERVAAVMGHLGVDQAAFVGQGMTSALYEIGDGRLLKIYFGPQDARYLKQLQGFSHSLQRRLLPYAVPFIYEFGMVEETGFQIERRLPGQDLAQIFPRLTARERRRSISALLDALPPLHAIQQPAQPYGELLNVWEEYSGKSWPGFLRQRTAATLARSAGDLRDDLPEVERVLESFHEQLDSLPAEPPKSLVHGDFFFGNLLCDERGIVTAVVDFSPLTLIGDPLVDLAGAYYFCRIYDFMTSGDYRHFRRRIESRYGPDCWQRINIYYTYYSLRFSDCKISDNHTYLWCLHRLRQL